MNKPFVTAGLLVVAVVVAAFWAWPAFQELSVLRVELVEKETELANREAYVAKLASLSTELEKYEPEMRKLNAALPSSAELPGLYGQLQQMSAESGLVLRQIASAEGRPVSGVTAAPLEVTLNLEGSYEGIKAFLAKVRAGSRLLNTVSVAFESPPPGEEFQFVVKLHAFSY